MKLLFIIGDAAVGKMTVGQELMKITDLRLFHNHMTIEPVIEIFGRYDGKTISEIRDTIFKNYAASDNYGMIFTMMMDFNLPSEWEYLEYVKGIFEPYGTDFYYVELIREIQHKILILVNFSFFNSKWRIKMGVRLIFDTFQSIASCGGKNFISFLILPF